MKVPRPNHTKLKGELEAKLGGKGIHINMVNDGVRLRVSLTDLMQVMTTLCEDPDFAFTQLTDLCGIDYSTFGVGRSGLFTKDAISTEDVDDHSDNFSRGRFAVVYHLLSIKFNHRLRVRVFLEDEEMPKCPSVHTLWPVANWFEREAFDLFGIVFENHPDLRRLLTDYGFIGHPFRKDFPIQGHVEMRYDPTKGRVVYQPVTIKPREVVPRIRRMNSFGQEADG